MNPIEMNYDALWQLAERRPALLNLVAPGNRIKFDKPLPIKEEVSTADLPEMRLLIPSFKPWPFRTSNSTTMTVTYQFQIASGDWQYKTVLNITWELILAMMTWHDVLGELEWMGVKYNKIMTMKDGSLVITQSDLNRGIKGWATLWACETEMWFGTNSLTGG